MSRFFLLKNCEKVVCGTTVNSRFAPFNAENDWNILLKRWYRNVEYLSRVIVKDSYIFGVRAARGTRGVLSRIICVDYSEKNRTVFAGGGAFVLGRTLRAPWRRKDAQRGEEKIQSSCC